MAASGWARYLSPVKKLAHWLATTLEERPRQVMALVLSAYGLTLFALLFQFEYLPMVDLPQHVSLLAAAQRLWEGNPKTLEQYDLNLFSPYLAGFLLPLMLVQATSLATSVKLTVWIAIMASPLSLYYCLKDRRVDPWWCLTGLLVGQGYAFDWGFLSYVIAVPFAILFVGFGCRYATANPSLRNLAWMGIATVFLFFTHALAFAFSVVIVGIVILFAHGPLKNRLARLAPMLLAAPLAAAWAFSDRGLLGPDGRPSTIYWGLSPSRLLAVLSLQIFPNFNVDAAATVLLVVIGILLVSRPKITSDRTFAAAALMAWVFVFTLPNQIARISIFPRLASILFPVSVAALETSSKTMTNTGRGLLVALLLAQLYSTATRLADFNHRVGDFAEILDQAELGRDVLTLIYEPQEAGMNAPYFLHFGHYMNARTGGLPGYSFAEEFTQIVRYKSGVRPISDGEALSWNASRFDIRLHGGFDYFLIRDLAVDAPSRFLNKAQGNVLLVARAQNWFLFRKAAP